MCRICLPVLPIPKNYFFTFLPTSIATTVWQSKRDLSYYLLVAHCHTTAIPIWVKELYLVELKMLKKNHIWSFYI